MRINRSKSLSGAVALAAILALACGGDDPQTAQSAKPDAPTIRPRGQNGPPRIESVRIEPRNPSGGGRVRAQVRASDPDGDDLDFGYVWHVNGRLMSGGGETLTLGKVVRDDTISVRVTASDGRAESAPKTATARVGNNPPVVQMLGIEPVGAISATHDVTVKPQAWDSDGDELDFEYTWWVNGNRRSSEATLETRKLKPGDKVQVEVVALDGRDRSEPYKSPVLAVGNGPPRVLSKPNFEPAGQGFTYSIKAEDPEGDRRLRYRIEKGPKGISVDMITGLVTWNPPQGTTGTFPVVVVVSDSKGADTEHAFTVTIEEEVVEAPTSPAAPAR